VIDPVNKVYVAGKSNNTLSYLPFIVKLQYKLNLFNCMDLNAIKEMAMDMVKKFAVYQPRVGHIIPISMGNTVCDIHNMQLICFKCHKRKTRKIDRRGRSFFQSIRTHRRVVLSQFSPVRFFMRKCIMSLLHRGKLK
jgi:5-methylcytosine-specific restriction endonuclease McrA